MDESCLGIVPFLFWFRSFKVGVPTDRPPFTHWGGYISARSPGPGAVDANRPGKDRWESSVGSHDEQAAFKNHYDPLLRNGSSTFLPFESENVSANLTWPLWIRLSPQTTSFHHPFNVIIHYEILSIHYQLLFTTINHHSTTLKPLFSIINHALVNSYYPS